MEQMAWDGPKWGQEDFFPTNPDLADILGRTDLDFETFHFFDFLDPNFLDFQVPRSQNSQIPGFPGTATSDRVEVHTRHSVKFIPESCDSPTLTSYPKSGKIDHCDGTCLFLFFQ